MRSGDVGAGGAHWISRRSGSRAAMQKDVGKMNTRRTAGNESFCETSLRMIDEALNSAVGAMLSLDQFDEVTRLRRLIRQFCEEGRESEARSIVDEAMDILRPHMRDRS